MMSAPNTRSGRNARTLFAERDGVGAQMPPLHALEHEIVARLQRQMQMRHQPAFGRKRIDQIVVGFDRIDGGQSQPLELRHMFQDLLHQRAELRRTGQGSIHSS